MTLKETQRVEISSYQQLYWLEWQLNPTSTQLNTPLAFLLKGVLDQEALQQALQMTFHTYLANGICYFEHTNGKTYQVFIQDPEPFYLPCSHWDKCTSKEKAIEEFIFLHANKVFDLTQYPIYNAHLLRLSKNEHVLVICTHHIISDPFTGITLINYLAKTYNHFTNHSPLPERLYPIQTNPAPITNKAKHLSYWQKKLQKSTFQNTFLSTSQPKKTENSARTQYFSLDGVLTTKLLSTIQAHHSSLSMTLVSFFATFLYHLTHKQQIVINYLVNTRNKDNLRQLGCFSNNLPMLFDFTSQQTFTELIHTIQAERKQDKVHQDCPIIDILQTDRKSDPMLQADKLNVTFSETLIKPSTPTFHLLEVESLPVYLKDSPNDLGFFYQHVSSKIFIRIDYQAALFSTSAIKQYFQYLVQMIQTWVNTPDCLIADLSFSSLAPQVFYKASYAFPQKNIWLTLFELADNKPSLIAIHTTHKVAYGNLVKRARHLAKGFLHHLNILSIKPQTACIGLLLEQSYDLLAAISGCFALSTQFYIYDLTQSQSDLQKKLKKTTCDLIITNKQYIAFVQQCTLVKSIDIQACMQYASISLPSPTSHPHVFEIKQPTYMCVFHEKQVTAIIQDLEKHLFLPPNSVLMSSQNHYTNHFVFEALFCFYHGHQYQATCNLKRIIHAYNRKKIACLFTTPRILSLIAPSFQHKTIPIVILLEEELFNQKCQSLLQQFQSAYILFYPKHWPIPIALGKNNANVITYPLGPLSFHIQNLEKLEPPEIPGQLYVQVIDGVTSTHHLYPLPWLAKRTQSNQIELFAHAINRQDAYQYQLTKSIEDALSQHPQIVDAYVHCLSAKNQTKKIAYYIPQPLSWQQKLALVPRPRPITPLILNQYLETFSFKTELPATYIPCVTFPLTSSQQLNTSALPKPTTHDILFFQDTHFPIDGIELLLKKIWQKAMQIENIGICDKFHALGGQSLLAAYLVTGVNETFNISLPISWIKQYNTIQSQAHYLRNMKNIKSVYQPVIEFHSGTTNPLYLIHPALCGVECYDEFSQYLDPNIHVLAIDAYNLFSGKPFYTNLIKLCTYYADEIIKTLTGNTLYLGGWSMGGVLALVITDILEKRGYHVLHNFLISAYCMTDATLEDLRQLTSIELLRQELPEQYIHFLMNLPPEKLKIRIDSLRNDYTMNIQCKDNFQIKHATLFKAIEPGCFPPQYFSLDKNGWDKMIEKIDVIPIQALHYHLMQGQPAKFIAEKINQIILNYETKLASEKANVIAEPLVSA